MEFKHVCKFCKKGFPCGRSLGGHIRSHLINNNNNNKSNSSDNPNQELGYELRENPKKTNKAAHMLNSSRSSLSIESKLEDGSNPNRDRDRDRAGRSSFVGGNNSNSSVSEVIETEQQEEVAIAMCLIMLSRDVGKWNDISSSFSTEFSDNISLLHGGKNSKRRSKREKIQGNGPVSGKKNQKIESFVSGHIQNGSKVKEFEGFGAKMKGIQVSENGFVSNDHNHKPPQSKRKVWDGVKVKEFDEVYQDDDYNDHKGKNHELSSELSNVDCGNNKRSKFECTTCNKVFHSYQALGGHRASHKKHNLGVKCSPASSSKLDDDDFLLSSPPPQEHKQHQEQQQQFGVEIEIGSSTTPPVKKVVQKHECPICFRVFPSGQALGGHKRSHLLAANNNNSNDDGIDLVEKSSSHEIRDLLDLNLPPVVAENTTTTTASTTIATASSSNSFVGLMKPYWWVDSSKHEPILGLISN